MVAGISKRQQLRNERALQDLIRTVPGNDRCADCSAMNPGWASWSIGVFLCVRCAALHRKMGTHISKVKSLSMDSWSAEQVDNMKSHGNTIMNKIYNPRNVKPPVPTDIDEADACMERFIRQKYQTQTLEDGKPKPPSRHDSGYTKSPEGSPPPLPPKPSRPFGFGLRSSSSATNLNRQSTTNRGLASPVSDTDRSSFESKMNTLREMGFQNERRNATVLRGLDGNLDKSIETLVRLGEGSQPSLQTKTPVQATKATSDSPFDQLDSKPPAQANANGLNYNPFDMSATTQSQPCPPAQPRPQPIHTQSLESSFQNLQVSQPLFPHSTGGYPNRQTSSPHTLFQQSAGPFTSTHGVYVSSQPFDGGNNPFFQTGAQPQASVATPSSTQSLPFTQTNPFFNQVSPLPSPMPPQTQNSAASATPGSSYPHPLHHANTMPALSMPSTLGQVPTIQQQQPQSFQSQPQLQSTQPALGSFNPFQSMMAPTTPQSAGYPAPSPFGLSAPQQQLAPQPTGRMDKNSILSLYSFSPQPSTIPEQQQIVSTTGVMPQFAQAPQIQQTSTVNALDHSAKQPPSANNHLTGSRNPFLGMPAGPGLQPQTQIANQSLNFAGGMNPTLGTNGAFSRGHMSQQSVDVSGFQNGRHSPDAFASLSARHG